MKVLGVSGSPIAESNTDRAVKAVLAATGVETEFVKLADHNIAPCRACLGCVESNRCVISDDGIELAEKVRQASGLVIGGYTPYSTLDARTKAFIERLYPLRHRHCYMRGKPGVAVITSAVPREASRLPPAADIGVDAIRYYMLEEGMEFIDAVKVVGNVPCIKCGHGDTCRLSGIQMLHGPDATVDSVGVKCLETQPTATASAAEIGRRLAQRLARGPLPDQA